MANIPPDLNPYNAPISSTIENAPGGAEAIRNQYLSHEASVKSIGLLYMLGGILGILVGALYLILGLAMMSGGMPLQKNMSPSEAQLLCVVMLVFGALFLGMSILQLYAAISIRKLGGPGRIIVTVFSCIGLLGIPFGTLISAYFLYLLWSEKGKYVFTPNYKRVIEATPHIKYKTSIVVWILLGLVALIILGGIAAAIAGG